MVALDISIERVRGEVSSAFASIAAAADIEEKTLAISLAWLQLLVIKKNITEARLLSGAQPGGRSAEAYDDMGCLLTLALEEFELMAELIDGEGDAV